MTHYTIDYARNLNQPDTGNLRTAITTALAKEDFESLTILFSSGGGSTDESISLYNFIRSLPKPVHMHATGHVGSAGIPVFLAGHKRTCAPFSSFFFHSYDWTFEGPQMTDRIEEALLRLKRDISWAGNIAKRHTKIPHDTVEKLYHKNSTPTIYLPEEAKNFGIVEDIVELNENARLQLDTVMWSV